jgi:putative glutathione S-transferase
MPGISETCNFRHIKEHYYGSHKSINPTRIVPKGPEMNLHQAHDRNRL